MSAMNVKVIRRVLGLSGSVLSMGVAGQFAPAQAETPSLPTGGSVASGKVSLPTPSFGNQTITQTSERAVINWGSFDVGADNSVHFDQPSVDSATLNRVTGTTASTIAGTITAPGSVFLINPNGVQITKSGVVTVGRGFVASSLDIADADFIAGKGTLSGKGGAVRNAGTITTGSGGYVGLLGGSVDHSGLIVAPAGHVVIGAVTKATLDLNGGGFLSIALPDVAKVSTDGSAALVSAADARSAVRNVVNLPGSVEATSASGQNGNVTLGGTVDVSSSAGNAGAILALGDHLTAKGTLLARATGASGNGGAIETSGNSVDFAGLTVDAASRGGDAGNWLIDPNDLVVDTSSATTINNALKTTNVALTTTATIASGAGLQQSGAGDIIINAALTWNSTKSLTLTAYNAVNIKAAISGLSGSLIINSSGGTSGATASVRVGSFELQAGNWVQNVSTLPTFAAAKNFVISGGNFLRAKGGAGTTASPYLLTDIYGLQGVGSLLSTRFALANDISATVTSAWNAGAGFTPIGNASAKFFGTIDGKGFAINGLTINRPDATGPIGLVGVLGAIGNNYGEVKNLTLASATISGNSQVGAIVGLMDNGILNSVSAAGTVTGAGSAVGGLVGQINSGGLYTSDSSVTVSGNDKVGGLLGVNMTGLVDHSRASGNVTSAADYVGGLVGYIGDKTGTVDTSSASGDGTSTGGDYLGGLVGANDGGRILTSSSSSNVTSVDGSYIGGLVGSNVGTVQFSNASGSVLGINGSDIGGLVGRNTVMVDGSFATTLVEGDHGNNIGGLVGENTNVNAQVNQSHADGTVQSYGGSSVGGLVGRNASNIFSSYATSAVTNQSDSDIEGNDVGGLVGNNAFGSLVRLSYATGDVIGYGSRVGGLAGTNAGSITRSYATSSVTSLGDSVGGFVGDNTGTGSVTDSYATGSVTANGGNTGFRVGGLVGSNAGSVLRTYDTGYILSNNGQIGGLVGKNSGTVTASFWNTQTTGILTTNEGGTGLTTAEMMTAETFSDAGWNTSTVAGSNAVWRIYDGLAAPLLREYLKPTTVFASSRQTTYNSAEQSIAGFFQSNVDARLLGSVVDTGGVGTDAGTYIHKVSGFYSTQQGYDIAYVDGSLLINKKAVGWKIQASSSTFGTLATTGGTTLFGVYDSDLDNVTAGPVQVFVNRGKPAIVLDAYTSAGTYEQAITGLNGSAAGNYTLDFFGDAGRLVINRLALTGSIADGSSVYGNALQPGELTLSGMIAGHEATAIAYVDGQDKFNGAINAGSYFERVALSGANANNYSVDNVTGNYTITRRPITAVLESHSIVYGSSLDVFNNMREGYSFAGAIAGDDLTSDTQVRGTGSSALSSSGHAKAGTYANAWSIFTYGRDSDNYEITVAGGNLTVTPLDVSFHAGVSGSVYGAPLVVGALTSSTPGLDAGGGILTGDLVSVDTSFNTAGNTSSSGKLKVGTYTDIVNFTGLSGADAANYRLLGGTSDDYTVTKAQLTGSIGTGSSVYGNALTPGAATLTGVFGNDQVNAAKVIVNLTGNPKSTGGAFVVGTYTGVESVSGQLSGADAGNYSFDGATGDYTITKRALTGSIADGSSIYGDPLAPGAISLTGLLANDIVATDPVTIDTTGNTSGSGNLNAGNYTGIQSISDAISGADAGN